MGAHLKVANRLAAIGQRLAAIVRSLFKTGHWRSRAITLIPTIVLSALLTLATSGCANRAPSIRVVDLPDIPNPKATRKLSGNIREVAPPAIFLDLSDLMESDQPQVDITYPKADQIIDDTQLNIELKLRGLSIYKDEALELGPHLQVILDNQPARSIYSLKEAITFENLSPGTHTLRVLAVRPWGESFKTADAYAQTTFHVFAKTGENTPDAGQPLLTYNQPQEAYGAEPVLLDFYLTNAPLHQIAQESDQDDIIDWKIACSVNGQSFVFDQWEPIYLKGLNKGQNWIQLTLIDEQGNPIDSAFNSTVRILNYDPQQRKPLDQIVRGELPLTKIGQIADPNYQPPAEPVAPTPPQTEDTPPSVVKDKAIIDESNTDELNEVELETENRTPAEKERNNFENEETELNVDSPDQSLLEIEVPEKLEIPDEQENVETEATDRDGVELTSPTPSAATEKTQIEILEEITETEEAREENALKEKIFEEETAAEETSDEIIPESDESLDKQLNSQINPSSNEASRTEEATESTEAQPVQSSPWQQLRQRIQSTWETLQPSQPAPEDATVTDEVIPSDPLPSIPETDGQPDVEIEVDASEASDAGIRNILETTERAVKDAPSTPAATTQTETSADFEDPKVSNQDTPNSIEALSELNNSSEIDDVNPIIPIEEAPIETLEIPETIEIPNTLRVPDVPSDNLLRPREQ